MIGIVHDWLVFEPKGTGLMYTHVRPVANLMNSAWGNDQFIEWFKYGTFTWKVRPIGSSSSAVLTEEEERGTEPHPCDGERLQS